MTARCSICYTALRDDDARKACPECRQDYHLMCWDEIGGCGTYGCKRAAIAHKPAAPAVVGAGWGDSKPCPNCAQQISSSWLVCRCGASFPWADPMTPEDYTAWGERQRSIASARSVLTWLFILSLPVVTSPVTGTIAGLYARAKRKTLASDGTFLAMGYGSAALGGVFSLLILITSLGR